MLTVRRKWGRVFQKSFLIKVSPEVVDGSFDNFATKNCHQSNKLFRPKSTKLKKFLKKNCFSSKCPSEGVGSSFENFTENFVPKVRKDYAQSPSMYHTRSNFFGKFCSFKNVSEHVEIGFDNPYVHFLAKVRKPFDHNPTKMGYEFFSRVFLIKGVVWTRRKILTNLQRGISKSRNRFRLKSEYP